MRLPETKMKIKKKKEKKTTNFVSVRLPLSLMFDAMRMQWKIYRRNFAFDDFDGIDFNIDLSQFNEFTLINDNEIDFNGKWKEMKMIYEINKNSLFFNFECNLQIYMQNELNLTLDMSSSLAIKRKRNETSVVARPHWCRIDAVGTQTIRNSKETKS